MSQFETFVNTELPKRIGTNEDPTTVPAGKVPVTTGVGLLTTLEDFNSIPGGTNTGDIIRWNAVTEEWESCAEPFNLKQINLTPLAEAMEDVEGGMYYRSTDKSIMVCTSDT